jgi:hypothetical protein
MWIRPATGSRLSRTSSLWPIQGGGVILFGVKNNGSSSGFDVTPVLAIDSAHITDKVAKYTGEQFADFVMHETSRQQASVAAMVIGPALIPLAFNRPGTYETMDRKQAMAFATGTVYFRHGAKSEPANTSDLRNFVDRQVERIRRSWLGNIRKVVSAPIGSHVQMLAPGIEATGVPTEIRLVTDPRAPEYRRLDPNITHPYRLKEVVAEVTKRLGGKTRVNAYNVQ